MTNLQEGIQLQAGLFVDGVRVLIEQAVVEAIANAAGAPSNRRGSGNGGQGKRRERRQGQASNRARRTTRRQGRKRSSEEVAALTTRLYETIDSQPGQTMGVLAGAMDCEPKDLRVSIRKLLDDGRVKKAGERMHTTYFPMGPVGTTVTESSDQ